jgi:SAM-dependent methyltransferase
MLATVASAWRRSGAPLDVTVVDRCPAPVLLCAWYGARIGLPVRTAVADVALYEDEPFDLICTHSLLTYPPLDARLRLVANWRRLLRPGGAVVTVTRLGTGAPARDADKQHARRFAEALAERCAKAGLDRDPIELRTRAERYVHAQVSHPVGDASDVRELFEQQGLRVTRLDARELPGALPARDPIGGAARGGVYGEIVAVAP